MNLTIDICRMTGYRADSRETMAFLRQLEYIEQATYDIEYPELKIRSFIPVKTNVPSWARTITYRQWDRVTQAAIIRKHSDNLPMVEVSAKEFSSPVVQYGDAYEVTLQDLEESAATGTNIDGRLGDACREGAELELERIGAYGDPETGLTGFLNHPNVPVVTLPTGSWASASALQILEDLRYLSQSVYEATKGTRAPDTMLFDTVSFGYLNRPIGDNADKTILEVFLRTDPHIKNVDQWIKLNDADPDRTGPALVCYQRSNKVVELVIPKEFQQLPPQARNLAFVINCVASTGGTVVRYPNAIAYAYNHR